MSAIRPRRPAATSPLAVAVLAGGV